MARIVIDVPSRFSFATSIPVRITDLNYGGHVGNDTILSMIHEARVQFLASYGLSEKDFAGAGLIMGGVAISYKNESFYGDILQVSVAIADITKVSFDIYYQIEKQKDDRKVIVAHAKTGMICFDYEKRRVVSIPASVLEKWQ